MDLILLIILHLELYMLQEECTLKFCFRSNISITGHWLNKNDFSRISCLLAIKRLKGKHTYDILAYDIFNFNHVYHKII